MTPHGSQQDSQSPVVLGLRNICDMIPPMIYYINKKQGSLESHGIVSGYDLSLQKGG